MMMRRIQLHASAGIGTERTGRARSAPPRSPAAARSCRLFHGRFRLKLRCPACPVSRRFCSGLLLRCRFASYSAQPIRLSLPVAGSRRLCARPPFLFLRHPLCAVPLPACPPPCLRGEPLRIPGVGRGSGPSQRRRVLLFRCSGGKCAPAAVPGVSWFARPNPYVPPRSADV